MLFKFNPQDILTIGQVSQKERPCKKLDLAEGGQGAGTHFFCFTHIYYRNVWKMSENHSFRRKKIHKRNIMGFKPFYHEYDN